jgi:Rha family phage regulatory protein
MKELIFSGNKTELMKIEIQNKDGQLFCNSIDVAKHFGKRHKNLLRGINNKFLNSKSNLVAQFGAANFKKSIHENRGKQYECYLMTKDGFSNLVFGFTGEKAEEFRILYINQFNKMEKILKRKQSLEYKQLKIEHSDGYKEMCKALDMEYKEKHPEAEKTPAYIYSNAANLHTKLVTGKTVSQLKKELNLEKKQSYYEYLTGEQFKILSTMNKVTFGLVLAGKHYKERKEIFLEKLLKGCDEDVCNIEARVRQA